MGKRNTQTNHFLETDRKEEAKEEERTTGKKKEDGQRNGHSGEKRQVAHTSETSCTHTQKTPAVYTPEIQLHSHLYMTL